MKRSLSVSLCVTLLFKPYEQTDQKTSAGQTRHQVVGDSQLPEEKVEMTMGRSSVSKLSGFFYGDQKAKVLTRKLIPGAATVARAKAAREWNQLRGITPQIVSAEPTNIY